MQSAPQCILTAFQCKADRRFAKIALHHRAVTRDDQRAFKPLLEALRATIEAQLDGGSDADESIRPDNAIGRLTRMEAIQAQSISAAGKVRLRKRLPQIARALNAIEEGTYGTCVACKEDIPAGRLEIRPESRLCVGCAAGR